MPVNLPRMNAGTVGAVSADVWNKLAEEVERLSDFSEHFAVPEIGTRWFKITSTAGGAGIYNAKSVQGWAGPITPTSNLSLPDTGEIVSATEDVVVENAAESGNTSGHTIPLNVFLPGWYTGETDATTNKPMVRVNASSGFTPSWGTLASAWAPGTNTCTLTPCAGPTSATATGAANVTCYIQFPIGSPAVSLAAAVGDILAYATFSGINMLFQPPQLPRPTAQYQVISNNSSDATAPNYIADYPREHS